MNTESTVQARIRNLSLAVLAATLTFATAACSAGPDDASSPEPASSAAVGDQAGDPDAGALHGYDLNLWPSPPGPSNPEPAGGAGGVGGGGHGGNNGGGGGGSNGPHVGTRQ